MLDVRKSGYGQLPSVEVQRGGGAAQVSPSGPETQSWGYRLEPLRQKHPTTV